LESGMRVFLFITLSSISPILSAKKGRDQEKRSKLFGRAKG
jgi:hypothetical protein